MRAGQRDRVIRAYAAAVAEWFERSDAAIRDALREAAADMTVTSVLPYAAADNMPAIRMTAPLAPVLLNEFSLLSQRYARGAVPYLRRFWVEDWVDRMMIGLDFRQERREFMRLANVLSTRGDAGRALFEAHGVFGTATFAGWSRVNHPTWLLFKVLAQAAGTEDSNLGADESGLF